MRYKNLFSPIKIGKTELANRVFMSPMHLNLSEDPNGHYTKRYIDYFKERAKSGVGLIITGHVKAERKIDPYPCQYKFPCLDRTDEVKYFKELVEEVHLYGTKIAVELSPGTGRIADCIIEGYHPAAPSEVPLLINPQIKSRALTREEIKGLIESYGVAAANAKEAGFDFIYVHASAYLIDQFLSPCWNQRTDEYGGSIENRMRFMMECIDSARKRIGDTFPLIAGFTMDQGVPNGKTEEDCYAIAKALEEKGILALHLRNGSYDAMNLMIPTNMNPTQGAVDFASRIKAKVSIPVLVDGGLLDPDICETILEEKKADMTGIGRPLLADPEWVKKAKADKAEEIRPCLRCMECINRVFFGRYSGCSVNPLLGREQESCGCRDKKKKNVLIIGGGQSGMLTALYAGRNGHKVTLVEKRDKLGGHMLEGSNASFKAETARYLAWIENQLKHLNVTIKTGVEADKSFVKKHEPDAVVICSGSVPSVPPVPGIEKKNVIAATDVLLDDSLAGQNVVIVGAGLVGCETAIDLAQKGRKVTLIDMLPEIGMEIIFMAKFPILFTINSLGIDCKVNMKLSEVTSSGVCVVDQNGEKHNIEADTVILATGLTSVDSLYKELYSEVQEIFKVGDCIKPRKFIDANREAYAIADLL